MTIRLDWDDAYCREFEATIVEQITWQDQPAIVLDRSCFYPTSGGQPHDTGVLAGLQVVDVVEREDGEVVHVLAEDAPDLTVGQQVRGEIDWARRFDHMQQHTGQHVLSAAFHDGLGAATLSFHLGPQICTIDVGRSTASDEELDAVEERANRAIWDNLSVNIKVHTAQEAAKLPLRKAPAVDEDIRVVTVADVDASACCGTHVSATGELGAIHIRGVAKQKGHLRVDFLVGRRAMLDYCQRDRIAQSVATAQSVAVSDLPEAVERLAQGQAAATKAANGWRKRWLDSAWPSFCEDAEVIGELRVVSQVLEGLDAGNMRYLAQQIIGRPGYVVLFAATEPSPTFCFCRSDDVDLNMNTIVKGAAGPLGGRGGGRPNIAQGGGVPADRLDEMLARAGELLNKG